MLLPHTELIETLWNVNSVSFPLWSTACKELIETLWNVNISYPYLIHPDVLRINRNIVECKSMCPCFAAFSYHELIETLWNVNLFLWTKRNSEMRINRNIVECKCKESAERFTDWVELIETLWNVNDIFCMASVPPIWN